MGDVVAPAQLGEKGSGSSPCRWSLRDAHRLTSTGSQRAGPLCVHAGLSSMAQARVENEAERTKEVTWHSQLLQG